ncbi:MAG: hypothetical protein GY943_39250, partial [Chloroflexi bacterium]|nr:hypothetical protein [Chloroflexota bacterium]
MKNGKTGGNAGGKSGGGMQCFKCHKYGHIARNCPAPPNQIYWFNTPDSESNAVIGDGSTQYSVLTEDELRNMGTKVKWAPNHHIQSQGSGKHILYAQTVAGTRAERRRQRTQLFNDNNNHNSRSRSRTRRYIFLTDVNARAATKAVVDPLEAPFYEYLKLKDYACKDNDGHFQAQIDTGANTPAMQTKYAVDNGFPIWKLRRPILVDTAGGIITCAYATVVSVLNTFDADRPYWMTTIFYLIDDIPINILIDRKTMRLLGLDIGKMSSEKYTHTEAYSQAWDEDNEADNMFYEQLLDPSILKPRSEEQKSESDDVEMKPVHTTGMAKVTSNYDTFHTRAD